MLSSQLSFIPKYLIPVVALWIVFWKGWAIWKAVRRRDKPWFVALLVVNSLGILPMLYLFFTRKTDESVRDKKKTWIQLGIGMFVVLIMAFIGSIASIGYGVKYACDRAQETYQGDCVLALMQYAEEPNNPQVSRVSAVWALGQFGDGRALPVLQNLVGSSICEPDNGPCIYEIEKAYKWCSTGTNKLSPLWNRLFMKQELPQ